MRAGASLCGRNSDREKRQRSNVSDRSHCRRVLGRIRIVTSSAKIKRFRLLDTLEIA